MWTGLVVTSVLMGLALFISAGTLDYWQAWVYLGVVTASSVPVTLSVTRDPILVESRTRGGPTVEKRGIQKVIVLCAVLPAIAAIIVPGLDHRFGWSSVPTWLSVAGNLLVIASLWMVNRVFKENSFASTTVEIASGQRVVSTGPYAIVRNPMYASAVVYFIGLSLALGSYCGLIASVLTILGFAWRLIDEERFLAQNLPGYSEYCTRVRWHLIPRVW
jgi:protein-S-isoprenylcysteine O-methyltransferase Ste14